MSLHPELTRVRDLNRVETFLELSADGTMTVYCGKVELGTGIATALLQIVADELGLPMSQLKIVMADTALTPDQGTTAGSKTIQQAGIVIRRAAYGARIELLKRASTLLGIPATELTISDGMICRSVGQGVPIPLGEFAGPPFTSELPETIPDRGNQPAGSGGTSVPRIDLLAKLTGGEAYVHDVRLDGMVHGRVIRPYRRTMAGSGRLVSVDTTAAMTLPGVLAIVRNGDFLGIVAEEEWQAVRAAELIQVVWESEPPLPFQTELHDQMRTLPCTRTEPFHVGDVSAAIDTASRSIAASYRFPMQAHGSLGPSCAVADVNVDGATIYTASAGIYGLRQALAPLLGLNEDSIRMIYREASGCYGHNGADDVTADAALLSQAVGRPVRLQWMRRDEFAWEPKGPAMLIDMVAALDQHNSISAWDHRVWTPTHTSRPGGQPGHLLAGQQIDPPMEPATLRFGGGNRNADTTYTFPNHRVSMHWLADVPLRPSALRSLGGLHNTTANEMFLDEIAIDRGVDPVLLRLSLLDDQRSIDVVEAVAKESGWGSELDVWPGYQRGRGFAFARYETAFAYVAMAAEVAIEIATGEVRVTRVVMAHDCGRIINPDGVRNQIEGNVIQGISRSLKEEITWDDQQQTSLTWESYPILTFPEVPEIDIVLIDRVHEPSWGAGEPAICPVAAAIGNAIFAACGVRLRTIPFRLTLRTTATHGPSR